MDYLPLEKIAEDLLHKIKTLKSGEMSANELGELVSSARDVYERLVILEFQALEKKSFSGENPTPFAIDTDSEAVDILPEKTPEPPEEIVEEIVIEEIKIESVITASEEEVIEEETPPLVEAVTTEIEEEESEPIESIAEKFENAPIENISKSISLNEKFQFIRVLCQNNSKSFQSLLDQLNESKSEKEALDTFSNLIPQPAAEEEIEVYDKFKELIKRRF